ncbi:MAG: hypothetical protein KGL64_09835 [Acidobacteriota bacterium]|nr:hypothetical protein [Acidobacteriota bacterium]
MPLIDKMLGSLGRILAFRFLQWVFDMELLLELFVAANLAILAGDIVLAHSVNQFRNPAEYIPLYFSAAAPALLLIVDLLRWRFGFLAAWRDVGFLVGGLSVLVGLGGVLYHLQSSFFLQHTVASLTYAAPFAAPLAYTGLGFLLLVNRMVPQHSEEWARWVVLLATGGFFGNFVLCLTDHATNGFFLKTEWIPVVSSALATGFLIVPIVMPVTRRFLDLCLAMLGIQALVGLLGFWYHLRMNLIEPGSSLFEKSINGAPPMAPLLFPNLVGLTLIGLWELAAHLPAESAASTSFFGRVLALAPAPLPDPEI